MTKGKFSGILLASDLDGTLLSHDTVPKINSDAIKYFTDNGGFFTVATGRTQGTIHDFYELLGTNAPLLMCNGMQIYDPKRDKYIFQDFMPYPAFDFFTFIVESFPNESFAISSKGTVYPVSAALPDKLRISDVAHLADEMNKFVSVLPSVEVAQAVDAAAQCYIKEHGLHDIGTMYSWPTHLEFIKESVDKGSALMLLADHLGVSHDKVFSIGDYMNDIPMLKSAHISFAPQNAVDEAKAAATKLVCHCDEGAVAAAIKEIEKIIG